MSQRNPDVAKNLEQKAEVDGDSQPIFDGDIFDGDSQPIFEGDSQPILDGDPISIFVDDDGDASGFFKTHHLVRAYLRSLRSSNCVNFSCDESFFA